jgi:hypothetical protein
MSLQGSKPFRNDLLTTLAVVTTLFAEEVICRLCASLYDEGAKKYLIEVAHLLGACFTDALKPSNTHLLVPRAAGAKWSRAAGMGVIPVVAGWLTDTMAHGIVRNLFTLLFLQVFCQNSKGLRTACCMVTLLS